MKPVKLNSNIKLQSAFCVGLTAMLVAGCGQKKSDDEPAPASQQTAQAPVPVQPAPAPTPAPTPNAVAPVADALAVEIGNRASVDGQSIQVGSTSIQFGLKNSQSAVPGIVYKCKLETSQNAGTAVFEDCVSPKVIQLQQAGQYYFTVMAVHEASGTVGMPTMISFTVGGSGAGQTNCLPSGQQQIGNGQQYGNGQVAGYPQQGQYGNGQQQAGGFGQNLNTGLFGNNQGGMYGRQMGGQYPNGQMGQQYGNGSQRGGRQPNYGRPGRPNNGQPNNGPIPDCIPNNGQGIPGGGMNGGGVVSGPVVKQVGDMFSVNVPNGFHMVSRSSTFDNTGTLNFQYIEGGQARDTAAPFSYSCKASGTQFQTLQELQMPAGPVQYCNMTPPILFNSPGDPLYNTFRFMTMNMMSYNSIVLSSDNSLVSASAPINPQAAMAKLYINVFTNVNGAMGSPFQNAFATELSQTVSRLNMACAGQPIQYLGEAPTYEGFYSWQVAAFPLFGCAVMREGQWYAEIGAFPLDQNMTFIPSLVASGQPDTNWSSWITQSFTNKRAAEIVVEIGPYAQSNPPSPRYVVREAVPIMASNIKKLLL